MSYKTYKMTSKFFVYFHMNILLMLVDTRNKNDADQNLNVS